MALCLVVEDDRFQRENLTRLLEASGFEVRQADSARSALEAARVWRPEVVLLDLGLPDGDGMQLIPELRSTSPLASVVVLTGRNSVTSAVAAMQSGASHYLVKPVDVEEMLIVLERAVRSVDRVEWAARGGPSPVFWGTDPAMAEVKRQLERLADHPATSALIEGETGTGKEVLARELHRLTAPPGTFVALNCAAVPSELMESELFGHEKGAFTGAESRRRGLVELARDGTLFLDEVGEMSAPMQAKLLRFLQDGTYRRVGGEVELTSACRFIAATHRDLAQMQADESFRSDLYYRLAVVRFRIPPLRDRRLDLTALAHRLLEELASGRRGAPRELSPAAERAILEHPWRGNVRELRNRLERAVVLAEGELIGPHDLDLGSPVGLPAAGADGDEANRIRRLMCEHEWNVSRAARAAGVERHWLRYRLDKHGIMREGDL